MLHCYCRQNVNINVVISHNHCDCFADFNLDYFVFQKARLSTDVTTPTDDYSSGVDLKKGKAKVS